MNRLPRRTFLAQASGLGLLALAADGLPRPARAGPVGLPPGIQLWTVHEAMQADPAGTLRQLQQIGYRNVESIGLPTLSATALRQLLDATGLACPSAHLNFMNGNIDAIFEDAHVLGARYAVSGVLRPGTGAASKVAAAFSAFANYLKAMTLEDAKRTAELANRVGLKAKQAGLQYAYHNHFMEFVDQGSGAIAYDVLLRECDPDLVKFELDCGWMVVAGHNPLDYLKKYPERFPMIHVKDFLPVADKEDAATSPGLRLGAELGHGFIDYRPILPAASAAGLQYCFVEQEAPFSRMNPLEAAKVDYNYLRAISG